MFRKMRRFKQQLTEDLCKDVLVKGQRGCMAVAGDDDYPYVIPLDYYYDPSTGHLFFHGAEQGHKMDSIRRNNKVSFNVMSEPVKDKVEWWNHVDSVTVFGRINEITNPEKKIELLRKLGNKYYPSKEAVEKEIAADGNAACILELVPDHMTGKHIKEF